MKRFLLGVSLLFGGLVGSAQPASAGIRCAADSATRCGSWVCCQTTCVYCEDTVTGEILSVYCSSECWDRSI